MGSKRKKQRRSREALTGSREKGMSDSSQQKLSRNITKLAAKLFPNVDEQNIFLHALTHDSSVRTLVWLSPERQRELGAIFDAKPAPSWVPEYVQIHGDTEKPGAHALHEEGAYYCLDLSSVFTSVALSIVPKHPSLVIDMCSAPGGKGVLAWRALSPKRIVLNEVIRKRTAQLIHNVKRCAIKGAEVTSNDPRDIGGAFRRSAGVVVVDAPCSGQSLLARDLAAPGAFHPATISANAQRQRRILAHSQECVKQGGYLLYSTCTFSPEENEETVEWFLKRFPQFTLCPVSALQGFQSSLTELPCYRLYPHLGVGAGSFCAIFSLTEHATEVNPKDTREDDERPLLPLRVVFDSSHPSNSQ